MAYTTEELEHMCLKVIEEKKLVFIDEICAFMPCAKSTFYNYKMEQMDTIKAAIHKNKVSIKHKIREDWEDGNPTEKIALYKVIGNQDERDALNGTHRIQETETEKTEFDIVDGLYGDS